MSNLIITICREYCSGGKSVGKLLAEKLNIKCYDRELISLAAKETGYSEEAFESVDEVASNSLLYSLVMGFGHNKDISIPNNDMLFAVQSDIIRKLAENESCVIVGRCADYILRDEEKIVKVFIRCDFEEREKRLMDLGIDTEGKTPDYVLHKMDKKRASYHKFYTGQEWEVLKYYDLVINTAKIGVEGAVEQILSYVNNLK